MDDAYIALICTHFAECFCHVAVSMIGCYTGYKLAVKFRQMDLEMIKEGKAEILEKELEMNEE